MKRERRINNRTLILEQHRPASHKVQDLLTKASPYCVYIHRWVAEWCCWGGSYGHYRRYFWRKATQSSWWESESSRRILGTPLSVANCIVGERTAWMLMLPINGLPGQRHVDGHHIQILCIMSNSKRTRPLLAYVSSQQWFSPMSIATLPPLPVWHALIGSPTTLDECGPGRGDFLWILCRRSLR